MSVFRILDIAGTAMNAQSVRLNATASNLANAESVSSSVEQTYKARRPLFSAAMEEALEYQKNTGERVDPISGEPYGIGVALKGVIESDAPAIAEYNPNHPLADENGYIIEGEYHNDFIAIQRILSFGADCTVLEPENFKKKIIEKLKSIRREYND